MRGSFQVAMAMAALAVAAQPAAADEIEESLKMALEAYQAGDINAAKEEIDFAAQLINQLKASALGDFLPVALEGWTRHDGDTQAAGAFGGGSSASAQYSRGQDNINIQLMANNQMVTSMAGMFGNMALMGAMGQVKRINRQKVVITKNGELQALIDNRILVQIGGNASAEDKEAYFAAMDIKGLEDF
jgi:hypothetical protein